MATYDMDMNNPNRGWYIPPIGRGRSLVVDLSGRGRGLRPHSSPLVGRGLLAFAVGRGRGLRPPPHPHIGRSLLAFAVGRGRGLRSPSPPH